MDTFWNRHRTVIILAGAAVLIGVLLLYRYESDNAGKTDEKEANALFSEMSRQEPVEKEKGGEKADAGQEPDNREEIVVDIKGAVERPGIYRMTASDRISDAIGKAGGFTKKADKDQINLAQKVADEMVIYIPLKGEKDPPVIDARQAPGASASSPSVGSGDQPAKININTADEQQLQELPGVGPAKAKAIIAYREEHGPFHAVDELTDVSGIGDKSLEQMREMAIVD